MTRPITGWHFAGATLRDGRPLPRPVPSAPGVICYAPEWDAVVCVPCQHDAGPAGQRELGVVRPATSDDIRRIGCCTSCGRDLLVVLSCAS